MTNNLFYSLIFIQLINLFNCEWNTNDFLKREHSLSKPYGGMGGGGIPYWDFIGSTVVSNKYVRLTADTTSLKGALWNQLPISMTDWEIQVQFKVHGHAKDLFGDGFVIWYAKDRNQIGDVFGSKDYFSGLAIILDTYTNNQGSHSHPHPYISAMVSNGTLHYNHDKDGADTELDGCEAAFRNKDYDTYVAIRYHNYKLTVSTDIQNKNAWKECFTVNNVRLPTGYYFGFSAATGDLSDNHDIISVKVYQLESERANEQIDHSQIIPAAESFAPPKDLGVSSQKSSWGFFKIVGVIILVLIVLAVIGGGIFYFIKKQSHNKKRFY